MGSSVRNDVDRHRYEISLDGETVGFAEYRVDGDVVTFPHTVVDPSQRGKGLAAELVRAALDDVRAQGRRIVPACWFVAQFVADHPAYADLVDPAA